jgi:hypothetical protein
LNYGDDDDDDDDNNNNNIIWCKNVPEDLLGFY